MTLTNTQRITALEQWETAHKAEHAKGVIHSHPVDPVPVYTFYEDFSNGLVTPRWTSNFHVPASIVTVFDQYAVVNNMLELSVQKMADGTWHGGLVDTSLSFKQLYGRFGVRVKVTQGKGLFAAPLWLYGNGAGWENEIDVIEIIASAPGSNSKGYPDYPYADVTLAHFHHGRNGSTTPLIAHRYHLPSGTFADDFHTFEVEWRIDKLVWYIDGIERARVTDPLQIPDHAMPIILDHTIGGSWAGAPDATTPSRATIWIDKVWATA